MYPSQCRTFASDFYPRSPCGERPFLSGSIKFCKVFLSTLSLRRATRQRTLYGRVRTNFYPRSPCGERPYTNKNTVMRSLYFYPRSPCGERRAASFAWCAAMLISIHALLAESDIVHPVGNGGRDQFLSTLSLRRATGCSGPCRLSGCHFYPRSPCGERLEEVSGDTWARDFYPRSPCGERLGKIPNQRKIDQFLSTLSLRRATPW